MSDGKKDTSLKAVWEDRRKGRSN